MATKHTSTALAKAADDEPIFVLRASDPLAADTVRHWAAKAMWKGVPPAKVEEAIALAAEMHAYTTKKIPD